MVQVIITQANNGFVVETKGNGMMDIAVAKNLAQVLKAVKATYSLVADQEEEAPF